MRELLNSMLRLENNLTTIKSLHLNIEELIKVQTDISEHIKSLHADLEQLPMEQMGMLRLEVEKINENLESINFVIEQQQSLALGEWAMGQLKIGQILEGLR